MALPSHNVTRDEQLRVGPRVSAGELNGRKSYGERAAECARDGHDLTVWPAHLLHEARDLCRRCGLTWAIS